MIEAAIETPTYDLTVLKLHFGRLTGKAYTKGERVLRFDAIAHNTAELRCGKMIDKFAEIVDPARRHRRTIRHRPGLRGHRIHPRRHPRRAAHRRPAGCYPHRRVDLNKSRMRDAVRAARALAPAPNGFTAAEFTANGHARTGHDHIGYSLRQATYGLRKLRGKRLDKPGRTRRYHVPPLAHHRRPAHPARPAHRPDPRRGAQPRSAQSESRLWTQVDPTCDARQ